MLFTPNNNKITFISLLTLSISFTSISLFTNYAKAEEVPPGFFRTPDGKILSNNPKTAKAPPGYYLRSNGTLIKLKEKVRVASVNNKPTKNNQKQNIAAINTVLRGFIKMPNGELMASDPSKAIVPEGYSLKPNGVLVANSLIFKSKKSIDFDLQYSYRFLKDLLDTTDKVTAAQVIDTNGGYRFARSPSQMNTQKITFNAQYRINKSLSIKAHTNYIKNSMTVLTANNLTSDMTSSGLSDIEMTGILQGPYNLTYNIALSLPTGNINVRGPIISSTGTIQQDQKYPYNLQLGSGSYDIKHGIRYSDNLKNYVWGGGYEYTSRMNKNSNAYKWGNAFQLDSWFRWQFSKAFSSNVKIIFNALGEMEGKDSALDVTLSPTMDATSFGGRRLDLSVGSKYSLKDYNMSFDFTLPVFQNLWGPQLATQWIVGLNIGAFL